MSGSDISIRETTQPERSGHRVGVSKIWERERDLPDARGAVAPRMSAQISILDVGTRERHTEIATAGSTLALGDDRYFVEVIVEGQAGPGRIMARKLER